MFGLKSWRRKRLRTQPFPARWIKILEKNVPLYNRLPGADKKELQEHILIFMAEKNFEGCGGLSMTEEIKVTISAQACLLLLHRETDYYPGLYSILVYPSAFVAECYEELLPGLYVRDIQVHLGESWKRGAVVLSWDHILSSASDIYDRHNVVLHEFAHQLDSEDGQVDGAPVLKDRSMHITWARRLGEEYAKLQEDARHGRQTLLDQYGATNPAEFFAVATECFFEKPVQMQKKHPELYAELKQFYQQDPAKFTWN